MALIGPSGKAAFSGRTSSGPPDRNAERIQALGTAARGGDRDAFGELYDLLADPLYAFARSLAETAEEAEDLVAEAFLRAWKSAPAFDPRRAHYRAWIFTILRNEARRQRSPRLAEVPGLDLDSLAAEAPEPSSGLPAGLRRAIARLDEETRTAIAMRYYSRATYSEIGQVLGIREGAARRRIDKALTALRKELERAST